MGKKCREAQTKKPARHAPENSDWTSQALTDTLGWSLEQGRLYEQSAQAAGYPSEVCVH